MKNKKILFIALLIGVLIIVYLAYFIKSKKVTDSHFLTVCKASEQPTVLNINLLESSKYIDHINQKKQADVLYIDLYSTTVFNFFSKGKKASIEVKDLVGINKVVIVDKTYEIDNLIICNK